MQLVEVKMVAVFGPSSPPQQRLFDEMYFFLQDAAFFSMIAHCPKSLRVVDVGTEVYCSFAGAEPAVLGQGRNIHKGHQFSMAVVETTLQLWEVVLLRSGEAVRSAQVTVGLPASCKAG